MLKNTKNNGMSIFLDNIKVKPELYNCIFCEDGLTSNFIKILVNNEKVYNEIYSCLKFCLKIYFYCGKERIRIYRKNILNAIELSINNNDLSKVELEKVNNLSKLLSFDYYKKNRSGIKYTVDCKNDLFIIDIKDIISFLQLNTLEFIKTINEKEYCGKKMEDFCYLVNKFINEEEIIDEYSYEENFIRNYKIMNEKFDLKNHAYFEPQIGYINNFEINEELENEILSSIPNNFNNLQKAIFIYYRLCQILSYDEEFYIYGKYPPNTNHKGIEYLSSINSKNNVIVCYEFNAIYAKFLQKLGIEFRILGDKGIYGRDDHHTVVEFRVDNMVIRADSTYGVLNSDLINIKNNISIENFKVVRPKNNENQKYLNDNLLEVKEYIKNNFDLSSYNDFDEDSKNIISKIENLSVTDKLYYLIDYLENSNLDLMDKLNYNCKICDLILEKYGKLIIMQDLDPVNKNKVARVVQVIVFNENGNLENVKDNKYYILEENNLVDVLNAYELNKLIKSRKYRIIKKYNSYGVPASAKDNIVCKVYNKKKKNV